MSSDQTEAVRESAIVEATAAVAAARERVAVARARLASARRVAEPFVAARIAAEQELRVAEHAEDHAVLMERLASRETPQVVGAPTGATA
jgi:hypothetical protein